MTSGVPQTGLHDFKEVLSIRNARGNQLVVVGGQAVNFWGEYYLAKEPGISSFLPLTSGDLDLLGTADDLPAIAGALKSVYSAPESGTATPVLGIVDFTTAGGIKTWVQVLLSLYGVGSAELKAGVVDVYNPRLALNVRVINPITCLKSKVANFAGLDQSRRQDARHIRILLFCNRGFLREVLERAEVRTISERAAVNAFEALLKFARSTPARGAAKNLNLDLCNMFPLDELKRTPLPKLQQFLKKRLKEFIS